MKTIEVMAEAIAKAANVDFDSMDLDVIYKGLEAIKEPDPHVVAAVADKLNMEPTKVAAVWMLMVERCLE